MRTQDILKMTGVLATLLNAGSAAAQDGAWILERVDSTLNAPLDVVAVEQMTLVDAGGREKVRTLQMYQKGPEQRMVKFVAPADVRDVGFLRLAEDRMYLYLPAFRRVRRISSSIQNEDFMGSDLSYEDLSRTRFGDDYRVVEAAPTEQGHELTLEPLPEADVSYNRIVMQVERDNWVITSLELFGRDGQLVKTVEASGIELVDGYWIARRMEVTTVKDGHRTILDIEELQFDTGLDDEFFSQRQLKRPV
jgi:outer membrane lipoprotein-sorting protein